MQALSQRETLTESPRPAKALLSGAAATLIAMPVAAHFFSKSSELAAAALIALQLGSLLTLVLEENRKNIWERDCSPFRANYATAIQFSAIFLGVFGTAFIASALFSSIELIDTTLTVRFRNDLSDLVAHNGSVLAAAFLFSVVYRAGGLVMVLAWNALHWAQSFASYYAYVVQRGDAFDGIWMIASLTPHLLLEAISYVVGGLAGTFLSKALFKYSLRSRELQRVLTASIVLIAIAVLFMAAAALVEAVFAQRVFHAIIG